MNSGRLVMLCLLTMCARTLAGTVGEPPRLTLPAGRTQGPLTFVIYGDTRFTELEGVANAAARRALVARIADDDPAAIVIGGDLVYRGDSAEDYATYRSETLEWARRRIPVYLALGNHEYRGCDAGLGNSPCLENWWQAFTAARLRPWRWYSLSIGPSVLLLVLDSDSPLKAGTEQHEWLEHEIASTGPDVRFLILVMHYPPVRDPVFPQGKDEAEVERLLSARAASLPFQTVVVGSHVHNYERYSRAGVTYLVSGGGGAKPVPAFRMSGELSQLKTGVNFHYLRFTLENQRLTGTMVRFDAGDKSAGSWSEPDRFEVTAR